MRNVEPVATRKDFKYNRIPGQASAEDPVHRNLRARCHYWPLAISNKYRRIAKQAVLLGLTKCCTVLYYSDQRLLFWKK